MKTDSSRSSGEDYPYNFIYEKLVSTPTDVVGEGSVPLRGVKPEARMP
jgi:hypothetical protein